MLTSSVFYKYLYHYQSVIRVFVIVVVSSIFFISCSSTKKAFLQRQWEQPSFENSFTGLLITDVADGKVLYQRNATKYFTPASTTKIATLYAALQLLPERLPILKYHLEKDTLYVQAMGNPTTLHPYFKDSTAIHFLKNYELISLDLSTFEEPAFGPGWAWEDYDTYFSPERSAFPMYGNVLQYIPENEPSYTPSLLQDSVSSISNPKRRDLRSNHFYISQTVKDTLEIPFITHHRLVQQFLAFETGSTVLLAKPKAQKEYQVLFGLPRDTILKRMMHTSDNFLAEQLLILASSVQNEKQHTRQVIDSMLTGTFSNLPQIPRWVDGSGLSRYNLFTPKTMVHILERLYREQDGKTLLEVFPSWQPNEKASAITPYIFAKSGSLGNNYNLAGYLRTKSGRMLSFCFMNNHFKVPTSEIKKEMDAILKQFWERY